MSMPPRVPGPLYKPFENLVKITVLGKDFEVPEGNILLVGWGCYTVYLMVRRPEDLATTENHPSWTHMYLMMMAAQMGLLAASLV